MDALELPCDAGAHRRPAGCGIGYGEFHLAEKDHLRPGLGDLPKWTPNGRQRRQNLRRFIGQARELAILPDPGDKHGPSSPTGFDEARGLVAGARLIREHSIEGKTHSVG